MPIMKMMKPAILILTGLLLLPVPTWGQSNKVSEENHTVSEEKRELIRRLNRKICFIANKNDFLSFKRMLKVVGEHHLGEAITVEEAYPYIRCNELLADNIDLFRVAVENPELTVFSTEFIFYFLENVSDKTLLGRIVSCRNDFGDGCLDIFDHIEKNANEHSNNALIVNEYKRLAGGLQSKLNKLGGPIRDPEFCREYLDELPRCQARVEDSTMKEIKGLRDLWAERVAVEGKLQGLDTIKETKRLWVGEDPWEKYVPVEYRHLNFEEERKRLIPQLKRLDTRLRERCRDAPRMARIYCAQ